MKLLALLLLLIVCAGCSVQAMRDFGDGMQRHGKLAGQVSNAVAPGSGPSTQAIVVGIGVAISSLATAIMSVTAIWKAANARRKAKGAHKRMDALSGQEDASPA